jgi:hypothetical protein
MMLLFFIIMLSTKAKNIRNPTKAPTPCPTSVNKYINGSTEYFQNITIDCHKKHPTDFETWGGIVFVTVVMIFIFGCLCFNCSQFYKYCKKIYNNLQKCFTQKTPIRLQDTEKEIEIMPK